MSVRRIVHSPLKEIKIGAEYKYPEHLILVSCSLIKEEVKTVREKKQQF